jgi:hypothetical protein
MNIHETLDQFKILFDEAAQQLNIRIHELAFWMVYNLGRTCPFVSNLMNITKVEGNSTYSSEMNVPKKCKKSEECLQIINTAGALAYASMPMALRYISRDWNAHCTLPTHQRFLCSNEKNFAFIQSLEPKHSITPNLDIF